MEFAPAYFEHAAKSVLSGQRTCLAKVLGMYQVMAKTPTGKWHVGRWGGGASCGGFVLSLPCQ